VGSEPHYFETQEATDGDEPDNEERYLMDMSNGRMLSNRYELGDILGYGGMSEVHKGRDVRLGRDVAVKVLRADLARDPTFLERFRREAQNAAALNHPAIVAVYDTGEATTDTGPLPYIVMEFVEGRTLRDLVKTEGPVPGKRAMEIMADVCAALDFSHRNHIIHRDVKPANVMITQTGAVKVMDFGIARALTDGQAAMTQTSAVIGTAQYLSPEQARGEQVDARSDVYSAGCVLYELLTAEPPFTGDSPVAVAYQHVREEPKAPSSVHSAVTPQLDAIVLKALTKNPANRYQSAAEMRTDLVRVLSGQRPSAPTVMTDEARTSIMAGKPVSNADDDFGGDVYDNEYADEQAAKKKKRLITAGIVAACIAVIVLAAWGTSALLGKNSSASGMTTVPSVVKEPQAQATSDLIKSGLSPNIATVVCGATSTSATTSASTSSTTDASAPPCTDTSYIGQVVGTSPAVGELVASGSKVTLYIGVAQSKVTVPTLANQTVADATTTLQGLGLTMGNQTTQSTSDDTLIGTIASSNPASGTQVTVGTAVDVVVYKGADKGSLPDTTGQDLQTAQANITGAGFPTPTINYVSSALKAGTVVSQTPKSGKKPLTTQVTLNVSKADQFTMPTIIGKTVAEAQSALQALGWTGTFNPSSLSSSATITDCSTAAQSVVGKTATIDIGASSSTGTSGSSTSSSSSSPSSGSIFPTN
jgi:serine/threonine-protein kinase